MKRELAVCLGLLILMISSCSDKDPQRIIILEENESHVDHPVQDTAAEALILREIHHGTDKLKVDSGKVIRVADEKGRIAEIGPGEYTMDDIRRVVKRSEGAGELPEKYMAYILEQMNHSKYEEGINVKPTVLRDDHAGGVGGDTINRLIRPFHLEIVSGKVVGFSWHSFDNRESYVLSVADLDGLWHETYTVRDTIFRLSADVLQDNTLYAVRLEGNNFEHVFYYSAKTISRPKMSGN